MNDRDFGRKTSNNSPHTARIRMHESGQLVETLSERELQVLACIAEGATNKEVADILDISVNTVLYHAKNIYGKLGVKRRTQAVTQARKLGLL